MAATGRTRGHLIVWAIIWADDGEWVYRDTGLPAQGNERPCTHCGKQAEMCDICESRHDPCIGHIDGALSVCCGHGIEQGYVVWSDASVETTS